MTDDISDVRHTSTLAKFEEAVRRSSPVSETLREVVAGIVDPTAKFKDIEGVHWSFLELNRREIAYRKADSILALTSGHAQEAKGALEVRQHIAWLFQYVQGMNEQNWRDMKLRAERQLEQLSLEFPGPAFSSTPENSK